MAVTEDKIPRIKTADDFGGYWLTAYKTFKGHDQEPLFQGNVTKYGKKVGFFSEDSWGGPARLESTKGAKRDLLEATLEFAKEYLHSNWCEAYHEFFCKIADAIDQNKWLKNLCKTSVVFVMKNEDGSYDIKRMPNTKYASGIKKELGRRYGDRLHSIINEQI